MPRIRLTKAQQAKIRKARMKRGFKAMKSYRPKVRKPLAMKSHNFTERVVDEYNLVVNGAGLFQSFQLDDVYNIASYKALFEYYKLNKVIITLRYKAAMNSHQDLVTATTQSTNETNPVIWFKVDHNDVNSDTLSLMKSSTRTKEIQFTNNRPKIQIVLKPAILQEAYKSTVASTYVPKWSQWLTTRDTSVPHYGIKMYATGPAAPSASAYGSIVVSKQYYFTLKNNE